MQWSLLLQHFDPAKTEKTIGVGAPFSSGTWAHVTLRVSPLWDHCYVSFDNGPEADLGGVGAVFSAPATVDFYVGPSAGGTGLASAMRIDNLVVR
jgi:hypothetical protein